MNYATQIAPKTQSINIINTDGTPRVDSRIIAQRLNIQHHNVMGNLRKYDSQFNKLGILLFETEEKNGRGQPEKYALLNEDQTVFALTLSRNTPEVVQLKLDLTVAFRDARHSQDTTQPAPQPLPKNIAYIGELSKATLTKCSPNMGVVYALELDNGHVKIGQTKNPHTRLANLEKSYRPFIKVNQVAIIEECANYVQLEKQLHNRFAENLFSNEFFGVSLEIVLIAMSEMELHRALQKKGDAENWKCDYHHKFLPQRWKLIVMRVNSVERHFQQTQLSMLDNEINELSEAVGNLEENLWPFEKLTYRLTFGINID